jgi:hypothetical protein
MCVGRFIIATILLKGYMPKTIQSIMEENEFCCEVCGGEIWEEALKSQVKTYEEFISWYHDRKFSHAAEDVYHFFTNIWPK